MLGLANPGIPAVYWLNLVWVCVTSHHVWTLLALIYSIDKFIWQHLRDILAGM